MNDVSAPHPAQGPRTRAFFPAEDTSPGTRQSVEKVPVPRSSSS
jgi:hypothetical protein